MARTDPPAPDFAARVRASFDRQRLMRAIGAEVVRVAPGEVEIGLPFRDDLTQQHGYLHAGILTALVDTACGYAALTLMPPDAGVLTVEYKVNFLAPAVGEEARARGRVTRAGRTLTVCSGEVLMRADGEEQVVATMLATMMAVRGHRERPEADDAPAARGGADGP
jgi:uncharacterized protein (TIGR00369 family)